MHRRDILTNLSALEDFQCTEEEAYVWIMNVKSKIKFVHDVILKSNDAKVKCLYRISPPISSGLI